MGHCARRPPLFVPCIWAWCDPGLDACYWLLLLVSPVFPGAPLNSRRTKIASIALGWLLAPALVSASSAQEAFYPPEPDACALTSHYQRVEQELRVADVSHLTPEQQRKRLQALSWLRDYRVNGDFGINTLEPGVRKLYFVDESERRCAVAWLLDESGQEALVKGIAATSNHAYIAELAGREELQAWLSEYGLSVGDAARIQGPAWQRPDTGGSTSRPSPPPAPPRLPSWGGPGDTSGGSSGPSTPAPSGPSAPRGGGANTPAPGGPSAPNNPSAGGPTTYGVGTDIWMTWWDLHKMDYLAPNLLKNWHGTVTGWTNDGANPLVALRASVVPALLKALDKGDAQLRGSAAIALGRIAGEEAIEPLIEHLTDPNQEVRDRAILGLGATGSMRAAEVLLEVAKTGRTKEGAVIAYDARSLAILALAIGRRNGMSGYVDYSLASLLEDVSGTDRYVVQGSGLLYQTMNPGDALGDWCMDHATNKKSVLGVRCRAVETLRTRNDDESLKVLLHHLSGNALELRRSAALTLGEFDHDLALQPLLTAAEVEKEPLTRAFILISIGRQGGDVARDFLENYLSEGPKMSRSWTALALGILARESGDEESRKAIRVGLASEKNREFRGAFYLAMGIAGDLDARGVLIDALKNGSSYEIRSGAAMGLGMLEDPLGMTALREQLAVDKCEYTRASITEAIAYAGDYNDCALLAQSLEAMKIPVNQATTAMALGLHGQRKSVEELVRIVLDEEQPSRKRAAAIDSLQVVLGQEPSLAVGDLLRQANFMVFPPSLIKIRNVLL
ncbi:MAG: HEAT repeat protein [Planctomycetota bacterium]